MFALGQKFESKKAHACGGKLWEIARVGADYKIKCRKCGHVVLIDYDKLVKLIKRMEE